MTNKTYELLADLLREEIEAYGKLFRLLEAQRSALMQQDIDGILSLNHDVEHHTEEVKQLNVARKRLVSQLHPDGVNRVKALIDTIEGPSQELFKEMVREINRLIRESQRQLSCNQMLYRRALDVSRETLRVLRPDQSGVPGIYRRDGNTGASGRSVNAAYVARSA